jgi:hypothetical protein
MSSIILVLSVAAVVSLLVISRAGVPEIHSEKDFDARILPVDLTALANLYDPAQIRYVRSRLTTREFAHYERQRGRVLIEYVKKISKNSALLVGFAHHIEVNYASGPAGDLLALALRVRVQSLLAICLLHIKTLFPLASIKLDGLILTYRRAMSTAQVPDVRTD